MCLTATDSADDLSRTDRKGRLQAIAALRQSGDREALSALGRIVANADERASVRIAAASALGAGGSPANERALRQGLRAEEAQVRIRVVRGLGRIGGPGSLPSLDKMRAKPGSPEDKELALARTLISYRNGIERDDISFQRGKRRRPGKPENLLPLKLRPTRDTKSRRIIKAQGAHPYGITLSTRLAFKVDIGRARWLLAINREARGKGFVPRITRKRIITGLMLRHFRATDTYSVQYIVLTRANAEGVIEILVMRTDGEMMYSGGLESVGKRLDFHLFDIERRGTAPTRVEGRLTPKGFELEVLIPFGSRKRKQRATAEPVRILPRARLAR